MKQEPIIEFEEADMRVYLTSAGDRRRVMHFVKSLLRKQHEYTLSLVKQGLEDFMLVQILSKHPKGLEDGVNEVLEQLKGELRK